MNNELTKECTRCKRNFPLNNTYYFTNNAMKSGFEGSCKECLGYSFQNTKEKRITKEGYKSCSKCLEELPINADYFFKSKEHKDGFLNVCKECKGYKYTYNISKSGYKICIKCKEELPQNKEYFYVDNSSKDGFNSACKDCVKGKKIDNFSIESWYEQRTQKFKDSWKLEDLKWLYDNYGNINKKEIIERFQDRNYKSITNIVYQWNTKKVDKNDNWDEDEIQFLISNYSYMPEDELRKNIKDRTWVAIKMKASKLGITRDEEILFKVRSESHIGIKPSEEARKKMSLARRGSKSWNWKGGISPLHPYFRDKLSQWKLDSLEAFEFKCALTNVNDGTLEIHHLYKNFSEIIQETFQVLDYPIHKDTTIYTEEQRMNLEDTFLQLHYKYGLGISLKREIHKLFHKLYGNKNNTPEQFEEFKLRWRMGEFKEAV